MSCDICIEFFWCWCDGGSRCGRIFTVRNSGIWFVWPVGPVTMWWVYSCRLKCVPVTDTSLTSSGIVTEASSFVLNTCSVLFFSEYNCKNGGNVFTFPTIWIRYNTVGISFRRRVYSPNCKFGFRSKDTINCGQNCVLKHILDFVNDISPFPIKPFVKASFQCVHFHQFSIVYWIATWIINGKILVNGTYIDSRIFLPIAHKVATNIILIKVI